MHNQSTIPCPNCKKEINIEEALYTQLESKFDKDTQEQREELKLAFTVLELKKEHLRTEEEQFENALQDALQLQLKAKEQILRDTLTKEITNSQSQAQEINYARSIVDFIMS